MEFIRNQNSEVMDIRLIVVVRINKRVFAIFRILQTDKKIRGGRVVVRIRSGLY
jgi:DNA segregation ATPase FtsK/SpoIIIE-like protein